MKDPYVKMINLMKERGADSNPPGIQLGTMINSNTLKVGDLQVGRQNLYIASYLVSNKPGKVITDTGTYNIVNLLKLKAGDVVAVMPTVDMQTYIILAKVVRV